MSASPASSLLAGFPPVRDPSARILILGSFPGVASLGAQQYYAHPRNHFWMLVGDVLGIALPQMDYATRLETLQRNGIALWDVVATANREGSLDSNIRNHASNDLLELVCSLPLLAAVAFNGATAARLGLKALSEHADRYRILKLPSSSPAYTLAYAEKLHAWRQLQDHLPAAR